MLLRRASLLVLVGFTLSACPGRAGDDPDVVTGTDVQRADTSPGVDAGMDITPADVPGVDVQRADVQGTDVQGADVQGTDVPGVDAATGPTFCSLAGAAVSTVVPPGFCMRRFARFNAPRTLAVAPNGDLFVGAPSAGTPGGAVPGTGSIYVLTDDDHDGVAESHVFMDSLFDVHGVAFGPAGFYYTTGTSVWRVPYAVGDRTPRGAPVEVGTFVSGPAGMRWTHGVGVSLDGTVYATQGNNGSGMCPPSMMDGAINALTPGATGMNTIAYGFRNPMYMRCHRGINVCLASELSDDSDSFGAPEKVVVVRPGSMYGYPCCLTNDINSPYNSGGTRYNCSGVQPAAASIPLHDTPFGLDWAPDSWPEPYRNALFVALHGSAYHPNYRGAALLFANTSPLTATPDSAFQNFIAYENRNLDLVRPTDVTFAPDGRLFLSDDAGGQIFWIAPTSLRMAR